MLDFLGLRWWQHMLVKGLHEHSIAAEVIGSTKTILIPTFQLCSSDLTTSFRLCRRRFWTKIALIVSINEAKG